MTNTPPPAEAYADPIKLRLVWHLEDILNRYGITKYALKKETGMSHNTIIFLCREETDRFNISNAEKLLNALRVLSYEKRQQAGEDLTISDLVTIQTTTLEGEVLDMGRPAPKPLVVPGAEPLLVPDEVQTTPALPATPFTDPAFKIGQVHEGADLAGADTQADLKPIKELEPLAPIKAKPSKVKAPKVSIPAKTSKATSKAADKAKEATAPRHDVRGPGGKFVKRS